MIQSMVRETKKNETTQVFIFRKELSNYSPWDSMDATNFRAKFSPKYMITRYKDQKGEWWEVECY